MRITDKQEVFSLFEKSKLVSLSIAVETEVLGLPGLVLGTIILLLVDSLR